MRRALPVILISIAGCDMFDPALYQNAQTLAIASDVCVETQVPVLEPSAGVLRLSLDGMSDDWQVANCGAQQAVGNDGFFAVDLEAGRKLHVHVNALDAVDPAVYIVDSCDERVCQPLNSASRCPGEKEHLSFLAPLTDRYFVGLDSVDPGGGRIEVLAIAPQCGDGQKEHGEPCEDGNVTGGDGCDAYCRNEIAAHDRGEVEPNDDLASGDVLTSIAGDLAGLASYRVRGTLEGPCDPEVFTFDLPEPGMLDVRVLDASGAACVGAELILYQGLIEVARAMPDSDGCSALEGVAVIAREVSGAAPTAASTYHVQLRSPAAVEPVPLSYTLAIELL